jgi:hypothetical protein
MQILLVEEVDLPREIGPVEGLFEDLPQRRLVVPSTLPRELHFPAAEVIQEAHVRLDEHAQPTGAHDEVCVDQGQLQVLHNVGDLQDAGGQRVRVVHGIRYRDDSR